LSVEKVSDDVAAITGQAVVAAIAGKGASEETKKDLLNETIG
jgi:hypothetical protein